MAGDYGSTNWDACVRNSFNSVAPYNIIHSTVKANDRYMASYSTTAKVQIFAHELGHVTGMKHWNSSLDPVYDTNSSEAVLMNPWQQLSNPQVHDKQQFDILYGGTPSNTFDDSPSSCHYVDSQPDLNALIRAAGWIVVVSPVASRVTVREDMPFTISLAKVEETLKGSLQRGQNIEVFLTGGKTEQVEFPYPDDVFPLSPGQKYLLFLTPNENGMGLIVGGFQGKATVDAGVVNVGKLRDRVGTELNGISLERLEKLIELPGRLS